MLRFLFDEPKREANGMLAETFAEMDRFLAILADQIAVDSNNDSNLRKYDIWTRGLRSSLNELEQSCYAASHYQKFIFDAPPPSLMTAEVRNHYNLYVYFDKNAFIRIFSLLDKLGTLLNLLLDMRTERVKVHYSYFTVLRNMRERNVHPKLTWKLNEIKESSGKAMNRLRKRRNTEIHYMNSEMQDDLIQSQRMYGIEELQLENTTGQSEDLTEGLQMVMESLLHTFRYAHELIDSQR